MKKPSDRNTAAADEAFYPELTPNDLFGDGNGLEKVAEQMQAHSYKKEAVKEAKKEEKKDTQDMKIYEETQRFSELSNIMKEDNLGERILAALDFAKLQKQVLDIVCLTMMKKEI